MSKYFVRAAVLGGIVVFLWSCFSWIVLPWHQVSIKTFTDEREVAQAIARNAGEEGIYILPTLFGDESGKSPQAIEERRESIRKGPVMFAAVSPFGIDPNMGGSLFIAAMMNIIGASLITWIVFKIKTDFWGCVGYVTLLGFLIGFLGMLPAWNWWNFPFSYVIVDIVDLTLAWFLGGLVISKMRK